ncbi:unnamed protein product, partial [Symbiodinium pilosum]
MMPIHMDHNNDAKNLAALEPLPPKLATISADVGHWAHWKVGTCENAIQGVKNIMDKLSLHDEHLAPQEALAEAVLAFNHKELVRGFPPTQHILGQAPDETGRFLPASQQLPPDLLVENPAGEFQRAVERRAEAEKALVEWRAAERISRAKNSRHRPSYNYRPGELVFYWRTQEANKNRRQPGGKHGRFLGPARILATESRTESSGEVRPGGAVWLVKGRSLLKVSPEQLRRATAREELLESLSDPSTQQTPWTFHAVAEQIGGNKFEDITSEQPDLDEWRRAQRPEEEIQPTRYRLRRKRPAPEPVQENEYEEIDIGPELPTGSDIAQSRGRAPEGQCTSCSVVDVSSGDRVAGMNRALGDLGAYFAVNMKRRAVELSEKKMTPTEREAFRGAKGVETKNFLASEAFQLLPPHLRPDKSQAIGMRWILSWKLRDDGTRKAKARAVLLGYQDNAYEHRATTSPVMTRQTRQMVAQLAAWKRWKL